MATNKTVETTASVLSFIDSLSDEKRREESKKLLQLMHEATGTAPALWGPSIIGFGSYHYVYESGREGDTPVVSFSPRKNALVLYGVLRQDQNLDDTARLGKVKLGKGCLYIKSLKEIDSVLLKEMVKEAFENRQNA